MDNQQGKGMIARTSIGTKRFLCIALGVLAVAPAAFCTDPDWSGTITQFKTDVTTMLTTYGPLVIGLLVTVLGWKFVVRWLKRSVKGI